MRDVMVDLETFGSAPGCVVVSIGAVAFNRDTGRLGDSFYRVIEIESAKRLGLKCDAETLLWWMRQGEDARAALTRDPEPIERVLAEFEAFWGRQRAERFWCHGATFDAPILDAAYRAARLRVPWKYSAVRDTRTLFELADVAVERSAGTHHNALDDAVNQARAVLVALAKVAPLDATQAVAA